EIGGLAVTLHGIAQGTSMITPDMKTMLPLVVTDADIEPAALQARPSGGVGQNLNSTTVENDTSTSDTLMPFATGAA
ncbi:bifunctional ornithine acetyltransferase/N-acetylglutamate synthase, partial [Rhizobium ruizarguesonis]